MLVLLTPLLAAGGGVLMYALAGNPKLQEVGRLTFFVGMLWLVRSVAGMHDLHLP